MREDELLSAYVDGELSAEEWAAVEARLRDDPRARKLVEELRAVSATLRALPRDKLGADLREAVLQQAQIHREPMPSDAGMVRRWAWAALALAAALLLAIYLPETRQEEQPVAQAKAKQREVDRSMPQLVGPAEETAMAAPLAAEEVSSPPAANETGDLGLVFEPATAQVAPGDNLAVGGQAGGLAGAILEAAARRRDDLSTAEDLEIHLSPGSPQIGFADFDQLLASQGIVVRSVSSGIDSRSAGSTLADGDYKLEQAGEDQAAAAEAELVLVEAPLEDIQKIIAVCRDEASPWRATRVVSQTDSASTSTVLSDEKLNGMLPVQRGIAIALNGLNLENESPAAESARAERPSEPITAPVAADQVRGWARHLGRGQAASKAEGKSDRPERREALSKPQATVRVLFILHPAAE
jgi:hypothetical protein